MATSLFALAQALPRDGLSTTADVAVIIMAAVVVIVISLFGLLALRAFRMLAEIRLGVRQNLGPVSDRARSISDNVEYISQVVRTDVEKLNSSVSALSDRLTQASDRMEERIEEFNALMEVVQGEAEDLFLDTASTVRGVREGAKAIANRETDRAGTAEAEEAPEVEEPDEDHEAAEAVDA